jgi:hypothetical protein
MALGGEGKEKENDKKSKISDKFISAGRGQNYMY